MELETTKQAQAEMLTKLEAHSEQVKHKELELARQKSRQKETEQKHEEEIEDLRSKLKQMEEELDRAKQMSSSITTREKKMKEKDVMVSSVGDSSSLELENKLGAEETSLKVETVASLITIDAPATEEKKKKQEETQEERKDGAYTAWKDWKERVNKEKEEKEERLRKKEEKENSWKLYRECDRILRENYQKWQERKISENLRSI